MKKDLAVVSVSGGLDSCVTAAIAIKNYELAFIHFNYGQRTEFRELKAFHDLADFYEVQKRLVVDFHHLAKIGGSSLTDYSIDVPKANLNSNDIPNSYVPFRNANMIAGCVSWAEVIEAKAIFIGAVNEDSSGYPDCRPEFFNAFEQVIKLGTSKGNNIKIETPIINMNKTKIVSLGFEIGAPLEKTWSCYSDEDTACGVCDSCALRLRGFAEAGRIDPINYKQRPIYK